MWHLIAHRNNLAQNKAAIVGLRKLYTVREAIVLKSPLQGTDKCGKTEVTAIDITFLADGANATEQFQTDHGQLVYLS